MTSFLSFFKRRACLLVCATSAQALKPDRKLTYKTAGDVKLKLDVFTPQGLAPTDQRLSSSSEEAESTENPRISTSKPAT